MNKITNKVLNKWKKKIGKLNIEKGWRSEPRSIEDHCALLHSEVSEAFEDYRNNNEINEVWYEYPGKKIYNDKKRKICVDLNFNESIEMLGKPCGIPSELSDIVIRALDMADEFEKNIRIRRFEIPKEDGFVIEISNLHLFCSSLLNGDITKYIELIITLVIRICEKYDIDLYQQIEDKIAYNSTRPARHGGKKI